MRCLVHQQSKSGVTRLWLCARLKEGPLQTEELAELWTDTRDLLVGSLVSDLDPQVRVAGVVELNTTSKALCPQEPATYDTDLRLTTLQEFKSEVRPSGFTRTASFTIFARTGKPERLTNSKADAKAWLLGFNDFDRASELLQQAERIYAYSGMNTPDIEFPFIFCRESEVSKILKLISNQCAEAQADFAQTKDFADVRAFLGSNSK